MAIRRVMPNIHSGLFEESKAFYGDFLGFELAMDMGWIETFASPSNSTAQISVISQDASSDVHPDISVEVDDVDALHDEAVRRCIEIVYPLTDEPWGVRRFFVADPSGKIINILNHAR